MTGLCEGGNEPADSLKISREGPRPTSRLLTSRPHAEAEVDDHPTRMEGDSEVVLQTFRDDGEGHIYQFEIRNHGPEMTESKVIRKNSCVGMEL
ncbi:hypothetical protein ANN_13342 [Periplaneta americana]|uniref:Uncharacterized protein n=1 Tax=Periplaneta americana TaxID=6978 RepID=A0ABQ8TLJ5_PERAM|nr:hypothetical protein ANN_13342 [Periplaneta americana]